MKKPPMSDFSLHTYFNICKTPRSKLWLKGRTGSTWVWVVKRADANIYGRQEAEHLIGILRKAHYPYACIVPAAYVDKKGKAQPGEQLTFPRIHIGMINIKVTTQHPKSLGGGQGSESNMPVDTCIKLHARDRHDLITQLDHLRTVLLGLEMPTCQGGVIVLGLRHRDEE